MVKCTFSGKEIPKGQGIMYVKKDGKILYFLNSKAEKNYLKLGRKPVHTKWSARYQPIAQASAAVEEEKKEE